MMRATLHRLAYSARVYMPLHSSGAAAAKGGEIRRSDFGQERPACTGKDTEGMRHHGLIAMGWDGVASIAVLDVDGDVVRIDLLSDLHSEPHV